jgi:hypothetical protein
MHNKHSLSEENKEMLRNQAIELIHHADELMSVLEKSDYIEPWVLAKAERATTDLSDITHYLEGHSEEMHDTDKFEDGGYMEDGGQISGTFKFSVYERQGNYYYSRTLKGVSSDNVMVKGFEGKLQGYDYNSAENIANAILDEHDYIDRVDIIKVGSSVLQNKKVAEVSRDGDDENQYLVEYFEDGGYMEKGGEIEDIGNAITEEYGIRAGDDVEYGTISRSEVEDILRKGKNRLLKYNGRFVTSYQGEIPFFQQIIMDLRKNGWNISEKNPGSYADGGYLKKGGVSDIIVIDILHYPSKKRALNTEISNEVLDKIDRYFTFVPNTNQEYVVKLKGASRGEYGINKEQGDKIIEIINNTEFKKMSDGGYMAKGGYISDRQMQSLNSGYELVIRTTLPDYHIIIKKEKGEIVYVIKKGRVYSAKKVKTFTSEKDAFTYLTNMAGEKVTKKKLED